jgi:endonuclease-3 related protein
MPHDARPCPPIRVYRLLLDRFGPQGWWPGESDFEVCVGAILVQNTAWTNVEKTLAGLRREGLLRFAALEPLSASELEPRLRSSGTFRVKARRLRAFLDFLGARYGGRAEAMRGAEAGKLRAELLQVNGIGRETADAIVLYVARRPVFVIDAYARRVFSRLGVLDGRETVDEAQRSLARRLPGDAALLGDYHAQLVALARSHCLRRPRCAICPLAPVCPRRGL